MNPLERLWHDHQQAVWLDFIDRDLLEWGGLARLVADDGVRGVTSNPAIFRAAITGSDRYDGAITELLATGSAATAKDLYEHLAVADIQAAADILRPVYDASEGSDGFVSLEVSPELAHDTAGTVAEARRLWAWVERPNLMIKVPATEAGIPAIEELLADGINVNVTLIFSLAHYEAVAAAYLRGVARAEDPSRIASVASFFVSRVDSVVDGQLEAIGSEPARALCGQAAVANARVAYARFQEISSGPEMEAIRARGGRPQRPLWASTSTKNPAYRDVIYVEELIGPDTVNTIPTKTLDAFRDHGEPRASLAGTAAEAEAVLEGLSGLGIDLDAVTEELQVAGVTSFADAFDELLRALETKRSATPSAV